MLNIKNIYIRRFQVSDAKAISKIIACSLLQVNSRDYPKRVINYMVNYFTEDLILSTAKKRSIFVALFQGNIVGTASLMKNVVFTVFVSPKFHKMGIGTLLMKKVEEVARKNGCNLIKVPSSLTAISFYKKLGYKKFKEKTDKHFGKCVIMRKLL